MITYRQLIEKSNPRIPRKSGQPAGSDKHSDLYTDENPRVIIIDIQEITMRVYVPSKQEDVITEVLKDLYLLKQSK